MIPPVMCESSHFHIFTNRVASYQTFSFCQSERCKKVFLCGPDRVVIKVFLCVGVHCLDPQLGLMAETSGTFPPQIQVIWEKVPHHWLLLAQYSLILTAPGPGLDFLRVLWNSLGEGIGHLYKYISSFST